MHVGQAPPHVATITTPEVASGFTDSGRQPVLKKEEDCIWRRTGQEPPPLCRGV